MVQTFVSDIDKRHRYEIIRSLPAVPEKPKFITLYDNFITRSDPPSFFSPLKCIQSSQLIPIYVYSSITSELMEIV